MYFIVKTHSVLCLLLSNDKFYVHFSGSLDGYEYEYFTGTGGTGQILICGAFIWGVCATHIEVS